nr:winged helix DNA-binding protein [uncultured Cellulosilyticum sp.]
MKDQLKKLNLIDLISEKHIVLRREVEQRWERTMESEISHTEAMLLAKLSMGRIALAEVARQANISRQAMSKCAKQLEVKGYLVFEAEGKGKYARLTEKGQEYCENSKKLKQAIEKEITEKIGKEAISLLKNLLAEDWL